VSKRILIINPWGVDYMDSVTEEVVAPHLRSDTEIVCASLGEAASPVPWPTPDGRKPTIEIARKAEADGFDAIVIGCCADPFLADTREAVSIPVIGLTESLCAASKSWGKLGLLARLLPDSYLPLIPSQGNWDFWTNMATGYGLAPDGFTMHRVFVPKHPDPDQLDRMTRTDPIGLRAIMLEAMDESFHKEGLDVAQTAVHKDGADVLFFACAFWSRSIDALDQSAEKFGAPIINPLVSAASYAEHLLTSSTGRHRTN
jgi:Asp/Glu/hydantoin racemase